MAGWSDFNNVIDNNYSTINSQYTEGIANRLDESESVTLKYAFSDERKKMRVFFKTGFNPPYVMELQKVITVVPDENKYEYTDKKAYAKLLEGSIVELRGIPYDADT